MEITAVSGAMDYPDRFQLLEYLRQGNYPALTRMLEKYQGIYEKGEGDEQQVAFFVETFANSDPDLAYRLDEWVQERPDTFAPYLARAYYHYSVAWSWRGHGLKENTAQAGKIDENLQSALADLSRVYDLNPLVSAAHALKIRILMLAGDAESRLDAFHTAVKYDPASLLVRLSYIWSLKPKWGGRPRELFSLMAETEKLLNRNQQLKKLSGYSDYIFAESLSDKGQYDDAKIHYDFAISKGAGHIVYKERGINYYQLGEYENALEDFNQSLEIWPQNPRALRWRANTFIKLGNYQKALEDLALANQLTPYDRYVLMPLAALRRKSGVFTGIAGIYDRALYYHKEDAEIWFQRGMHFYRDLFNFDLAAGDLKRATEIQPDNPDFWYHYAAVLHYNMDCEIVTPLNRYLGLCADDRPCDVKELEWANKADQWLHENDRCMTGEASRDSG